VQAALQTVVAGLGYSNSSVTVGGINGNYIIRIQRSTARHADF